MKLLKPILIVVGIIIIAVVGYSYLGKKKTPQPASGLSSTKFAGATGAKTETQAGRDFLSTLLNLNTISLDNSVLASPVFSSLEDFTIKLEQQGNEGRPNPFAPVGTEATVVAENTLTGEAPIIIPPTTKSVTPAAPAKPTNSTTR